MLSGMLGPFSSQEHADCLEIVSPSCGCIVMTWAVLSGYLQGTELGGASYCFRIGVSITRSGFF